MLLKRCKQENMEEGMGFEPMVGSSPTVVFKTTALDRSASLPLISTFATVDTYIVSWFQQLTDIIYRFDPSVVALVFVIHNLLLDAPQGFEP